MSKGVTFWKQAGLSYLQYLNISARAVRSSLKQPLRENALARQAVSYNKRSADDIQKISIKSSLPTV